MHTVGAIQKKTQRGEEEMTTDENKSTRRKDERMESPAGRRREVMSSECPNCEHVEQLRRDFAKEVLRREKAEADYMACFSELESTAKERDDLKAEVDRLKDAIFSMLCGDPPDSIDVVRQFILKEGCKGYQCGHPLDPPEYDCPYDLIGDCESCPIVTEQMKANEGGQG